nr:hypothetical protein EC90111_0628 [Escherichia coli 9.0111]
MSRESPGLSPLARGTPKNNFFQTFIARFIPAGAGNSAVSCGSIAGGAVYPRWRGELEL